MVTAPAAAEIGQLAFFQQVQLLEERRMPEIPGVIVGEADEIEVARQHRHDFRIRTKRPRLFHRLPAGGHHAFKVSNTGVGRLQDFREVFERVLSPRNHLARQVRQHDVAGKHQIDLFLRGLQRRQRSSGNPYPGGACQHACHRP